jgi:hypothetical protein
MILLPMLAAAAAMAEPAVLEPDPKAMSQKQIRAFNAKLAKGHPYYIVCRKSAAIGSLVKRDYSCRTNAQWQKAEEIGNQDVRDTMDKMQSKSWNTSG